MPTCLKMVHGTMVTSHSSIGLAHGTTLLTLIVLNLMMSLILVVGRTRASNLKCIFLQQILGVLHLCRLYLQEQIRLLCLRLTTHSSTVVMVGDVHYTCLGIMTTYLMTLVENGLL